MAVEEGGDALLFGERWDRCLRAYRRLRSLAARFPQNTGYAPSFSMASELIVSPLFNVAKRFNGLLSQPLGISFSHSIPLSLYAA
jgi:hypothetical protein